MAPWASDKTHSRDLLQVSKILSQEPLDLCSSGFKVIRTSQISVSQLSVLSLLFKLTNASSKQIASSLRSQTSCRCQGTSWIVNFNSRDNPFWDLSLPALREFWLRQERLILTPFLVRRTSLHRREISVKLFEYILSYTTAGNSKINE